MVERRRVKDELVRKVRCNELKAVSLVIAAGAEPAVRVDEAEESAFSVGDGNRLHRRGNALCCRQPSAIPRGQTRIPVMTLLPPAGDCVARAYSPAPAQSSSGRRYSQVAAASRRTICTSGVFFGNPLNHLGTTVRKSVRQPRSFDPRTDHRDAITPTSVVHCGSGLRPRAGIRHAT
jgi:hypothetical protein